MTQQPTIFLDLDGVCAAWSETVFAMYGKSLPEKMGYDDVHIALGVTEAQMWERINSRGVSWWANLPYYPWFPETYTRLRKLGPKVVFLTSPCRAGYSATGKIQWLRRHVGEHFRDYVITPRKELLAHSRAILIDDSTEKCAKFVVAGGYVVIVPRIWNEGGRVPDDEMADQIVGGAESLMEQWATEGAP